MYVYILMNLYYVYHSIVLAEDAVLERCRLQSLYIYEYFLCICVDIRRYICM
jgi:hypothetical protein